MQDVKQKEKKERPFSSLFQRLSPEEFVCSFHDENIQTLAFILHYADEAYIRKVIDLIKDESNHKMLTKSLCDMKNGQETSEPEFIAEIEKAALELLEKL